MSNLVQWLWRACAELHLPIEPAFRIRLRDGKELATIARIPDLGAKNGMLIVGSYDDVKDYAQDLIDAGYGYSVLDEPGPKEEFDLSSFRDMFVDWGWTGKLGSKPAWMDK